MFQICRTLLNRRRWCLVTYSASLYLTVANMLKSKNENTDLLCRLTSYKRNFRWATQKIALNGLLFHQPNQFLLFTTACFAYNIQKSGDERKMGGHIMCSSSACVHTIFAETRMYYSYTYYYENWCLNILLQSIAKFVGAKVHREEMFLGNFISFFSPTHSSSNAAWEMFATEAFSVGKFLSIKHQTSAKQNKAKNFPGVNRFSFSEKFQIFLRDMIF